jgi:hypothetical protein
MVALVTGYLGSSTALLFTLQHHSRQLSDLDSRFDDVREKFDDEAKIYSICEAHRTYILGYISVGLVSLANSLYKNLLTKFF